MFHLHYNIHLCILVNEGNKKLEHHHNKNQYLKYTYSFDKINIDVCLPSVTLNEALIVKTLGQECKGLLQPVSILIYAVLIARKAAICNTNFCGTIWCKRTYIGVFIGYN
jgi:hypothetical protein